MSLKHVSVLSNYLSGLLKFSSQRSIATLNYGTTFKRFSSVAQSTSAPSQVEQRPQEDDLFSRIELEMKGHDQAVLRSYEKYLTMAAKGLDIPSQIKEPPRRVIKRISLLKSAFAKKKHFVQYESRTHFSVVELQNLTGSTALTYLEYVQRNLPEGVLMKVTSHQVCRIPSHLVPPTSSTQETQREAEEHKVASASVQHQQSSAQENKSKMAAEESKSKMAAEESKSKMAAEESKNKMAAEESKCKMAAEEAKSKMAAEKSKSKMADEESKSKMAAKETKSKMAGDDNKSKMAAEKKKRKMAAKGDQIEKDRDLFSRVEEGSLSSSDSDSDEDIKNRKK